MKVTFSTDFELATIVYLKTDRDQLPRLVVGHYVDISNTIMVELKSGTIVSTHQEFEISKDRDTVMATTN